MIPICIETEVNVAFDFNYVTGETRVNLTCSDVSAIAVVKCNHQKPVRQLPPHLNFANLNSFLSYLGQLWLRGEEQACVVAAVDQ
jgi:hypothetical protein